MRALLPIAILSVLGVAAASAVGCSASTTITLVPHPTGAFFVGPAGDITWGSACTGNLEYVDGSGWAVCDNGTWGYTTTDPGYPECTASDCGGTTGDGGGTTGMEGGGTTGMEGGGTTGMEGGGSTGMEGGGSTGMEGGGTTGGG